MFVVVGGRDAGASAPQAAQGGARRQGSKRPVRAPLHGKPTAHPCHERDKRSSVMEGGVWAAAAAARCRRCAGLASTKNGGGDAIKPRAQWHGIDAHTHGSTGEKTRWCAS